MPPRKADGLGAWKSDVLSVQKRRDFCAHVVEKFPIDLDSRRLDRSYWTTHLCSSRRRDNAAQLYSRRGMWRIDHGDLVLSRGEGLI